MSCNCLHTDPCLKFPITAPQPNGPRDRWPAYFVPSATERGMGEYYCPRCEDGLQEARREAGLIDLRNEYPTSLLKRIYQKVRQWLSSDWKHLPTFHRG